MPIKSRTDNQESYAAGYDAIFGKPGTKKKKKTTKKKANGKPCVACKQPEDLVYRQVSANRTSGYFACVNKKCKEYMKPPQVIENCGTHDTFSYRAGANMSKAQGERRAAEAASHMGTDPFGMTNSDFNLGEGIFDPETRPGLS